jgi:hypothetical protein
VPALTIKESRRLVMPLDTVLEALLHFDGKSHGPLSRGEVLQADLVRDIAQGDGIDVAVRSPGAHVVDWHHFNFATIAAAINSYCRSKRIPLPYSGVKSLEVTREGIAFHIENTVSIARRPAVSEDCSGQALRYARGYEPHAISPSTRNETCV